MKKGLVLAGEPLGLLIAQTEGDLSQVKGYDLAVAGAEFNVAVGVARLQHSVTYIAKLGQDPFGKRIFQGLKANHIGTECITWSKAQRTGFMLKGRVMQGDPPIFYYRAGSAASTLSPADIAKVDFSAYSHLHLTGILPALSTTTRAAVDCMLTKARAAGLYISFDPNLRPALWPNEAFMRKTLNKLTTQVDLFLPGTAEGKILMGSDVPQEINAYYRAHGVQAVVTKCGSQGAFVTEGAISYQVAGYKATHVVDTVGAGDGFAAGVLTGLMESLPLREAVRRGTAIGAMQVMCRGDNEGLPTPKQLQIFMQSQEESYQEKRFVG